MHIVPALLKLFPWWQREQGVDACAPTRGNPVFAWSNPPPQRMSFTSWHWLQSVLNPAALWLGAPLASYSAEWQL
jgi:hypothetical protein